MVSLLLPTTPSLSESTLYRLNYPISSFLILNLSPPTKG